MLDEDRIILQSLAQFLAREGYEARTADEPLPTVTTKTDTINTPVVGTKKDTIIVDKPVVSQSANRNTHATDGWSVSARCVAQRCRKIVVLKVAT